MEESKQYNTIFRTTILFGFVQALNILVKVILNKVAAIVLGTKGVGLIGLFNSAIGMLKTGTGLGISQSAVRDISEANGEKNIKQFSKAIVTTNFVIVFTSLFGLIFTVAISPLLSKWVFDDYSHALSFVLLSLAVAFTILNEGKMAILKGMRRLRILAKSNILGAIAGLILSVPIYIIYKVEGIVPVLIVIPFVSFLFSFYFVKKIEYQPFKSLTMSESASNKTGATIPNIESKNKLSHNLVADNFCNLISLPINIMLSTSAQLKA